MYPQSIFEQKNKKNISNILKNIKHFLLKILHFYNFKNLCILHGHVFVMVLQMVTTMSTFDSEHSAEPENSARHIRKTCPGNVYPLKPHFYIAKLGYAGVYYFFLFLFQNIDRRGGSNVYSQSVFCVKPILMYNFKNLCILHGLVFVMQAACRNQMNFEI